MTEDDKRRLQGRLRRIVGQISALDKAVDGDPERFVTQLEAVIAAGKASLRFYVGRRLINSETIGPSERKLLARLIEKF